MDQAPSHFDRHSLPPLPPLTRRAAARVARRALMRDILILGPRGLVAGAVGGAAALAAARVAGIADFGLPLAITGPCLGLGAGLLLAIARRWPRARAASEIDRRLNLRDRLSSALALAASPDPFARLAVADAERTARTVRPRQVVPIRRDWSWALWPVAGGALVAAWMWVPVIAWDRQQAPAGVEGATTAVSEAREAVAPLQEGAPDPAVAPAIAEELRRLDEIERELAEGALDPVAGRMEASGALDRLADRFADDARRQREAADRLREQLAALPDEPPRDDPPSAIAEALREGNLERAADAAQRLIEQAPEMTPEQRREAARELDDLTRMLDEAARQAQREAAPHPAAKQPPAAEPGAPAGDEPPQPAEPPTETPEPPGAPDTPPGEPSGAPEPPEPADPADPAPPTDPPAEPAEPGQPGPEGQPQQPDSQPQAPQDQERQPGAQGGERQPGAQGQQGAPAESGQPDAANDLRDLSDAARQAADELRQEPHPSDGQPPETAPAEPAPGQQEQPQPGDPQPGEPQGDPQPAEPQPGQPDPGQPQPGEPQQGEPQPAEPQPGEPAPGQSPPQLEPGQDPQPGEPEPGAEPGQPPEPAEQQPGQQSPEQQPGQPAGNQPPDGQQPEQTPGAGSTEGEPPHEPHETRGMERFAERLREAARQRDQADQTERQSEELRERAREMLENMSPEERRELLDRWAGAGDTPGEPAPEPQPAEPDPWNPQTETVDARRPATEDVGERAVAEWFTDQPGAPTGRAPPRATGAREVRQTAERAIEQETAPRRRHDLIRKVFTRYAERLDEER